MNIINCAVSTQFRKLIIFSKLRFCSPSGKKPNPPSPEVADARERVAALKKEFVSWR